jgi:beta-lactamase class D
MAGRQPATVINLNLVTSLSFPAKRKFFQLLAGVFCTCFAMACTETNQQSARVHNLKNDSVILRSDFSQYFQSCHVTGTIVLYDYAQHLWILSDSTGAAKESLPASTFKIINLLILLETKTIADENELVKWPGKTDTVKYGYRPEIYHDMTVREAFELSAGWVFVELAKKMGKLPYKKYLAACNYGNRDLSEKGDDFWNFGAFAISPINQVEFLKKLYDETLPFSKRNMQIVKRVMISEQAPGYVIRAKTGWTRDTGTNTGWWVGYIENDNSVYFFATKLLQGRKISTADFGNCRKTITKKVLKEQGILD